MASVSSDEVRAFWNRETLEVAETVAALQPELEAFWSQIRGIPKQARKLNSLRQWYAFLHAACSRMENDKQGRMDLKADGPKGRWT